MKNTILRNSIVILTVILLPALVGAAQAGAVDYKSTYRGIQSQPVYGVATTATAPSATFQSTSAYSEQWEAQPSMLNADGSVNSGAYMTSGPNRAKKDEILPPNPDVDEDDPGNTPLGEGILALMLMAGGYALARRKRNQ